VDEVSFCWRARFPILPPISVRVVDRYAGGHALLEARLLGLVPVLHASGQKVAEGEAMRYLAELPWVPHALLVNDELRFRELDARTVEVATQVGATRVAVQLAFDASGDLDEVFAEARPRAVGKEFVPPPWGGRFGDYGA